MNMLENGSRVQAVQVTHSCISNHSVAESKLHGVQFFPSFVDSYCASETAPAITVHLTFSTLQNKTTRCTRMKKQRTWTGTP